MRVAASMMARLEPWGMLPTAMNFWATREPAIIIFEPPNIFGTSHSPTVGIKTSMEPASRPPRVKGRVTRKNLRAGVAPRSVAASRTERSRPWRRFLVIALALHLPLFAYPVLRLCHWLALGAWLTAVLFLPLFFSQIVARVYLRDPKTRLAFWLRRATDIWLGISPVLLCLTLLGELPVLFDWFSPDSTAQTILTAAGLLTIYSIANAYVPSVVTVQLSSAKLKRPLSFVQITDVHIGSRSSAFKISVRCRWPTLNSSIRASKGTRSPV